MPSAEEVRELLLRGLPGSTVAVTDTTGGGDHFAIEVECDTFAGLRRVEQHRLVHRSLGPLLGDGTIHAVQIKTRAPQEEHD